MSAAGGVADNTPVLIGVGEASERIDAPDYAALSPVALAAKAAEAALRRRRRAGPGGARSTSSPAIRQFEISGPNAKPPFGASNNFPRSVGKRIGADPARAVLEIVGGQGPQHLVNEFAHAIAAGEAGMVLLVGLRGDLHRPPPDGARRDARLGRAGRGLSSRTAASAARAC